MLLGQSAISKLGAFQFDPNNGALTILNTTNKINNSSEDKKQPIVEVAPITTNTYSQNEKPNISCDDFLYKTNLTNTTQEYLYLFSTKTYSDKSKIIATLPKNATLYVIEKSIGADIFYLVCYNGVKGYISKFLLQTFSEDAPKTTQKNPTTVENGETDAIFILKGNINSDSSNGKSVMGADMELKKNGQTIVKISSGINGKYYLQMSISTVDKNNEYLLYITQGGTIPKILSINTYIPQEEYYKYPFVRYDVSLTARGIPSAGSG
ncbi:MAG: hypothetical protein HY841_13015 [Bacteroidetes bacterium]|nr:hypothetical protein [Bacteroidota bacterium]